MEDTSSIGAITNEHAVLLEIIPGCDELLDYVKAVASIIGGSHIHSVFKDGDFIKVYLKEKHYVSAVINSRLLVREQRTKVKFAAPSNAKLVLIHVDPIIPDAFLETVLRSFGPLKSNITRPLVSEDIAYSHIVTGTREVLLDLPNGFVVPKRRELEYKGKTYDLILKVEPPEMSTKITPDKQFFKKRVSLRVPKRNKTHGQKRKKFNEDLQSDSCVDSSVANNANNTVIKEAKENVDSSVANNANSTVIEEAKENVDSSVANNANSTVIEGAKENDCSTGNKTVKKRRGRPPKKVPALGTINGLQSGLADTSMEIPLLVKEV